MSDSKLSSALNEAQNIIEAAEKRAKELIDQAAGTRDKAKELGYQEGYEEGMREAVQSAVRLLEDRGAIGNSLAEEAARLALAIAGTVIGEHVKVHPDTIREIAVRALQEAVTGDSVVVITHPEDLPTLEKASQELRRVAGGVGVVLESDAEMSRGSCLVRSEFGEVDARIETLLETIAAKLGVALKSSNGKGS